MSAPCPGCGRVGMWCCCSSPDEDDDAFVDREPNPVARPLLRVLEGYDWDEDE